MGGENDGKVIVFRGAEVGNAPNTFFENIFPVRTFVKQTLYADLVNNEAIIFGKGGVNIRQGFFDSFRSGNWGCGRRSLVFGDGGGDGRGKCA